MATLLGTIKRPSIQQEHAFLILHNHKSDRHLFSWANVDNLLAIGLALSMQKGVAVGRPGGLGGLSEVPVHPADLAHDEYEEEVALGLLANEARNS